MDNIPPNSTEMENEQKGNTDNPVVEKLAETYLENRKHGLSKYFYLYFFHLLGKLQYREEGEEAVFYNETETIRVPLPLIDSEEKFQELQKTHRNLEKVYENLKEPEAISILDDL